MKLNISYKRFIDTEINSLSEKDFKTIYKISDNQFADYFFKDRFNKKKSFFRPISNYLYLVYNEKEIIGYLFGEKNKSNFKIKWMGIDKNYRSNKIGLKLKIRVLADLRVNGIKKIISEAHTDVIKRINEKIISRSGNKKYILKETESKNHSFKHRFKSLFKVKK
jgi:hypothetical protein